MSRNDTQGVIWQRTLGLRFFLLVALVGLAACSEDRTEIFKRSADPQYWNTRAGSLFWFAGANKTVKTSGLVELEDSSAGHRHATQDDPSHQGDHGDWPPTGGVLFDEQDWMVFEGSFEDAEDGFTILAAFRLDQPPEEVERGTLFSLGVSPAVSDLSVQRGALFGTIEGNEYDLGITVRRGEPLLVVVRQFADGAIRVRLNGEKVADLTARAPSVRLSEALEHRLGGGLRVSFGVVAAFDYPLEQQHVDLFETSLAAQFYCCKPE